MVRRPDGGCARAARRVRALFGAFGHASIMSAVAVAYIGVIGPANLARKTLLVGVALLPPAFCGPYFT